MNNKKHSKSSKHWLWRFILLSLFVFMVGVGLNLRTYQALTKETAVATISFKQQSTQTFIATLTLADKSPINFMLQGDEWQLDAKMVKWKPLQVIFGTPAIFRVERLSGRYFDIQKERQQAKTAYQISTDEGLSIWKMLCQVSQRMSAVDAVYGSAVYLPMKNQAAYDVSMGLTGLVARPSNQKASNAVYQWQ